MKTKKKKLIALIGVSLMILGVSFAYFTDSFTYSTNGKVGTLEMVASANIADSSNMGPGDYRVFTLDVANTGTLAMDTRVTFNLKNTTDEFTPAAGTLKIYKASDVLDENGDLKADISAYSPIVEQFGTPVAINYGIFNGTTETVAAASGKNELEEEYVLILKSDISNDYQDMTFSVEALVEARQYTNAHELEWSTLTTEDITFNGSSTYKAVPSN